ncbi:Ankyrin repeat-containing protein BDA1 [Glycine soja]
MYILEDPKLRDDAMRELYEASLNGCVSTLKTLIQKGPLILSRISLYPYTETPLHIASLLGHLDFCEVLLQNSPSLATELNSEGRCPLHLASANGHTEVVKALLRTNPEMCLVGDKDEMLPLHFAAMRGRVGAIKELIKAKPDSIREMTKTNDGSIQHLCVRYNHLEALKLLVESLGSEHQFLYSLKYKEDNTLLHLAVKRRQIKIIKYLLSLSEISAEINSLNKEGLTSMDIISQHILTANEVIAQEAVSSTTLVRNHQTTLSTSRQEPTSSQSITIVIVQPDPPGTSSPSQTNNDSPSSSESLLTNNDHELAQVSLQQTSTGNSNPPSSPASQSNGHVQAVTSTVVSNQETTLTTYPQQQPTSSQTQSVTIELAQQDPPPQASAQLSQLQQTASQSNAPVVQPANITTSDQRQQGQDDTWSRLERFFRTYLLEQGNWIDNGSRKHLLVVATVIATMAFTSVINPPGGVWQGDTTQDGFACHDYGFCEAGTAVMGYAWPLAFVKFLSSNSLSFFLSLCVMLVLVIGFPVENNKVVMWMLAVLIIGAATCMMFTYVWALGLISPNHIFDRSSQLGSLMNTAWMILLTIFSLIQTSRIGFWFRSRFL